MSAVPKCRAELKDAEAKDALKVLKEHRVKERVTKSLEVQQLEFKGQKIVTELFQAFYTDPYNRLLEPSERKRIKKGAKKRASHLRLHRRHDRRLCGQALPAAVRAARRLGLRQAVGMSALQQNGDERSARGFAGLPDQT